MRMCEGWCKVNRATENYWVLNHFIGKVIMLLDIEL
jgi:hypothetical protein